MKRRQILGWLASAAWLPWLARAQAPGKDSPRIEILVSEPGIVAVTKGARLERGRVKMELPVIADNGNAVPLKISVASPMTPTDHVRAIHLVSDRNPVPNMASFHLGPHSGRAELETRVRLAGSQNVTVIAEMSDGTFWMDRSHVQVTLSACADES
ncbi:MAG: thiosulfate oxidation carrier protein SoxY [Burkholderiales bacterium]